jgi:hypothetical protein
LSYLYVNRFVIAQKLTELEHKTIKKGGGVTFLKASFSENKLLPRKIIKNRMSLLNKSFSFKNVQETPFFSLKKG